MKKDKHFNRWFKAQFKFLPMSPTEFNTLSVKAYELSNQLEVVTQQLANDRLIQDMYRTAIYTKNAAKSKKPFSC